MLIRGILKYFDGKISMV